MYTHIIILTPSLSKNIYHFSSRSAVIGGPSKLGVTCRGNKSLPEDKLQFIRYTKGLYPSQALETKPSPKQPEGGSPSSWLTHSDTFPRPWLNSSASLQSDDTAAAASLTITDLLYSSLSPANRECNFIPTSTHLHIHFYDVRISSYDRRPNGYRRRVSYSSWHLVAIMSNVYVCETE